MSKITVVGGKGFIGSAVVEKLARQGYQVSVPEKNSEEIFTTDNGTILYCAGHGDCKNNPFKVFEANTNLLSRILEKSQFNHLIYLSSTRLYIDNAYSTETTPLSINSEDPRRLFNLSKLTSEELCLRSNRNVTILRVSNVFGLAINSPLFLPMLVKDSILKGKINMYVAPTYEKDYLLISDLLKVVEYFVKAGRDGVDIFNVASGVNVPASEIAEVIQQKTGCEIVWHPGYLGEKFPVISIEKIKNEMSFSPHPLLKNLKGMIETFSNYYRSQGRISP